MLSQDQIRQIKRRLHEAEHGTTQEKVSVRSNYAEDVKLLLGALEESGTALAIARIDELEQELAKRDHAAEMEARKRLSLETTSMPRYQARMPFQAFDGKMAAAGKDD